MARGTLDVPPPYPFEWEGNRYRLLTRECDPDAPLLPDDDPVTLWETCEAQKLAIFSWLENHKACPHPERKLVKAYLGTRAALRDFRAAVHLAGVDQFPLMNAHLPTRNAGIVPIEAVPAFLAEVRAFQGLPFLGEGVFLLDDVSDHIYGHNIHPDAAPVVLMMSADHDVCLDADGVFVRARRDGAATADTVLFRSKRFQQVHDGSGRPINDPNTWKYSRYFTEPTGDMMLYDPATNQYVVTPLQFWYGKTDELHGMWYSLYPHKLHVERRPYGGALFGAILAALEQLAVAALAADHPICWD